MISFGEHGRPLAWHGPGLVSSLGARELFGVKPAILSQRPIEPQPAARFVLQAVDAVEPIDLADPFARIADLALAFFACSPAISPSFHMICRCSQPI